MHVTLQLVFDKLEKQRLQVSRLISIAPAEKQQQKPAADQWSAAQVFYHLWLIEQQVIRSLEKTLASEKSLQVKTFRTRFRSALLNTLLRLPLKFKAPSVVNPLPEQINVEETERQWATARKTLHSLLTNFPDTYLNKEIIPHPRVGMLTLNQVLEFLYHHHAHHQPQLNKLVS